ncbi:MULTISPECIES: hypothetical protein [Bacillus cereus group]|uniref:hypothetical protein n=1 Tax=Bacillus cereus group TaxID=86661 RepID=UPI001F57AE4D|nr:hypothetical protein [Bacillus cereus group sp. BfR-BA-01522]
MVGNYAIEIKDMEGKTYLLCMEGRSDILLFETYEEAGEYNYEFEDTLKDGLTSRVTTVSEYLSIT